MGREAYTYQKIIDGATANGLGKLIPVRDFKIIVLAVTGANSPDFDVIIKGAVVNQETDVNFSAPAGPNNQYGTVGLYSYRTADFVDGSIGVEFTGSADTRLFEVNVSGLTYLRPEVINYLAGSATVTLAGFSNL